MGADALAGEGVTASTPVWRDGLADWLPAGALPELEGWLATPPPPVPVQPAQPQWRSYSAPQTPNYAPGGPAPAPEEPMPPTHLAWAIVTTLLCCIPLGIVAVFYSGKVSSRYYAGDYEGARRASNTAAIWVMVTVVVGLIWAPFQLVLALL